MNAKFFFALLLTVGLLVAVVTVHHSRRDVVSEPARSEPIQQQPTASEAASPRSRVKSQQNDLADEKAIHPQLQSQSGPLTNKLARLNQVRENFQALAAGDSVTALRAAKDIKDETERETALMTLATQWTQGELRPARERASAIERYGLEGGLGMELANNPDLAVKWAAELTDGPARRALLSETAVVLAGTDPAAAFALADQVPEQERSRFFDSVFAGWAAKNTEAALQWANQLPEADQAAAIAAIRTSAPVGIGTALAMKEGYPFVAQLFQGSPAELSGQLHQGDRIVGLAQGDNSFIDTHNLALNDVVQMIRGQPGSPLQLQILPAGAPEGTSPQIISITRDQLKFKRP